MHTISGALDFDGADLYAVAEEEVDFDLESRQGVEQEFIAAGDERLGYEVLEEHAFVYAQFVVQHTAKKSPVGIGGAGHGLG